MDTRFFAPPLLVAEPATLRKQLDRHVSAAKSIRLLLLASERMYGNEVAPKPDRRPKLGPAPTQTARAD